MSTATSVYDQLRAAIIKGSYSSGQPLRQDQIANDYGVSKIPVREALVQLEADGFVEMFSGRGFFVARLSITQAEEIYLIRQSLEPVLLARAIPETAETQWLRAGGILAALQSDNLPFHQWHALDYEFHTTLYSQAPLPQMKKLTANLHSNLARYYRIYETLGSNFHATGEAEHRAILEACLAGETDKAVNTLAQHLNRSKDQLMKALTTHNERNQTL